MASSSSLDSQTSRQIPFTTTVYKETTLSIALYTCACHVSSLRNFFQTRIPKEYKFTPEEGKQLYQEVINMGSNIARALNILVDAGIPVILCGEMLENMVKSENLEAVHVFLRGGVKPSDLCVQWAVIALDYEMMDLLLKYGASKDAFKKHITKLLSQALNDPARYLEKYHTRSIPEDLRAWMSKLG